MQERLTTNMAKKAKNTIGENIHRLRKAKGISQLALGKLLGWAGEDAGAQISRFERGRISPRYSTLAKLSKALGVGAADLLTPQK